MSDNRPGFWHTIPGILTATAGVITALSGLLAILYQSGMIGPRGTSDRTDKIAASSAPVPAEPTVASVPNEPAKAPVAVAPIKSNSKSVNLLASDRGGQLIAASGNDWLGTIDGKEDFNQISRGLTTQSEAVYAFQDERSARFDRFGIFIPGTDDNIVKEFELSTGNARPTGPFEPIGRFQTQNVKLFKTPYQQFEFPQVTAKYLKLKLLSTHGGSQHPNVPEVQLYGELLSAPEPDARR